MVSSTKPTIVMLHGAWHSPSSWQRLVTILESQGYPTECSAMPTTGPNPGSVSLYDDAKLIHSVVEKLVDDDKEVIVVMHSYGGVVGTQAVTKDLNKKQRELDGKEGGVIRLLYVCAFVLASGKSLVSAIGSLPPWVKLEDNGSCTVPTLNAAEHFYHDLSPADQKYWVARLQSHSTGAQNQILTNVAYKFVPSSYLFCEDDRALPLTVQQMMVENCEVEMSTETCGASHSPFLSMPKFVAGVIGRAAAAVGA